MPARALTSKGVDCEIPRQLERVCESNAYPKKTREYGKYYSISKLYVYESDADLEFKKKQLESLCKS